ncbi:hypothetical protein CAOG_01702 [Capsaspora owczarzaki ATCC 30864]|uniref:Actin-fragmin kinase catalytic domain-containing protein n=1 Tax=Capsaspora owczarzaki (strain ATCC 30864) TaxID=595528 RepID=A0A0D2WKX8_CAPO3|nr:hypothetical protein CAOG_01702 [Capsaspora owczarzaki ATCC 30864]KJE90383.1 hypothetical protein CAOG_001702 [Capsaspora owczarzaki ATCC 30864]|eukprot:XP_004364570.1 hypothetical protein CAOG_01702 [Capsaspora owczarzaki ATCC 30864]
MAQIGSESTTTTSTTSSTTMMTGPAAPPPPPPMFVPPSGPGIKYKHAPLPPKPPVLDEEARAKLVVGGRADSGMVQVNKADPQWLSKTIEHSKQAKVRKWAAVETVASQVPRIDFADATPFALTSQFSQNRTSNATAESDVSLLEAKPVPWSTASALGLSHAGAGGVYFIQFPDKSVVVVKGSQTTPQEFLAFHLAALLGADAIRVPWMRVVDLGSNEHVAIQQAIRKYLDPVAHAGLEKSASRPFLIVMEFVPGSSVESMTAADMKRLFHGDNVRVTEVNTTAVITDAGAAPQPIDLSSGSPSGSPRSSSNNISSSNSNSNSHSSNNTSSNAALPADAEDISQVTTVSVDQPLSPRGKELLEALGRVVTFDMWINNWDRFPCVWDNEGNPNNVLVVDHSGPEADLCAIDQMVTCLDPRNFAAALDAYKTNVRNFLVELRGWRKGEVKLTDTNLGRLRSSIELCCGYSLTEDELSFVRRGILDMAETISTVSDQEIRAKVSHIKTCIAVDWENTWSIACNSINEDHLLGLRDVFAEVCS